MKIYKLTQLGYAIASNPNHGMTPAMKALYYLKRNGNTATDEQLHDLLGNDYYGTVTKLSSGSAPAIVAS